MTLLSSNITFTDVNTEVGNSPALNNLSELCADSSINPYSFYAPGFLKLDASKYVYWLEPSINFKLGDFRLYNHSSNTPRGADDFSLNYTSGDTSIGFIHPWYPENLNIKEVENFGDYITFKYYSSIANRNNDTAAINTVTVPIQYADITPLVGHTRDTDEAAGSTQIPQSSITVSGFSGTTSVYARAYISNVSGTLRIELPDKGYTTITCNEITDPIIRQQGNITGVPAGYTAAFLEINDDSTPLCFSNEDILVASPPRTDYQFYCHVRGVYGTETRIMEVTDCSIFLTVDTIKEGIYSGSLSHSSNTLVSFNLQDGGNLSSGDTALVTIENVTFGSNYTTC